MAQQWKLRRGTTSENDAFTGVEGEVTVDTTEHTLRVHDGTTPGGHIVGSNGYHPNLFDWKWTDHQLDDVEWLRADTFSWQSGLVYEAAYQHLINDTGGVTSLTITNGITLTFNRDSSLDGPGYYGWNASGMYAYTASDMPDIGTRIYYDTSLTGAYDTIESVSYNATAQTETIAGTTIQYYKAQDGHKIVFSSQESKVSEIYANTGVAWYYILDVANKKFKLPRTKFGATGLRDVVGKYVEAGLPDHTHDLTSRLFTCDYHSAGNNCTYEFGSSTSQVDVGVTQGVSTNSVYGNSDTVQPKATQMYLYFYMGAFTQEAIVNTAGINTEIINDFSAHRVIAFQAPAEENNYTWYRLYADGWVEQGGHVTLATASAEGATTITLPITMSDTNYTTLALPIANVDESWFSEIYNTRTTNTFQFQWDCYQNSGSVSKISWKVEGMAAQGE